METAWPQAVEWGRCIPTAQIVGRLCQTPSKKTERLPNGRRLTETPYMLLRPPIDQAVWIVDPGQLVAFDFVNGSLGHR